MSVQYQLADSYFPGALKDLAQQRISLFPIASWSQIVGLIEKHRIDFPLTDEICDRNVFVGLQTSAVEILIGQDSITALLVFVTSDEVLVLDFRIAFLTDALIADSTLILLM